MQYINFSRDFDYRIVLQCQPIRELLREFWRANVSLVWKVIVRGCVIVAVFEDSTA